MVEFTVALSNKNFIKIPLSDEARHLILDAFEQSRYSNDSIRAAMKRTLKSLVGERDAEGKLQPSEGFRDAKHARKEIEFVKGSLGAYICDKIHQAAYPKGMRLNADFKNGLHKINADVQLVGAIIEALHTHISQLDSSHGVGR